MPLGWVTRVRNCDTRLGDKKVYRYANGFAAMVILIVFELRTHTCARIGAKCGAIAKNVLKLKRGQTPVKQAPMRLK